MLFMVFSVRRKPEQEYLANAKVATAEADH
jgi:hypothetical protein